MNMHTLEEKGGELRKLNLLALPLKAGEELWKLNYLTFVMKNRGRNDF